MADKYRHLRPRIDRSCNRQDRIPKRRLTEADAERRTAGSADYHAYECPLCGWWHTGRKPRRQEAS